MKTLIKQKAQAEYHWLAERARKNGGCERIVNGGWVQWCGSGFYHDVLRGLSGKTVVVMPSKKRPRSKIKVFFNGRKLCTIALNNMKLGS